MFGTLGGVAIAVNAVTWPLLVVILVIGVLIATIIVIVMHWKELVAVLEWVGANIVVIVAWLAKQVLKKFGLIIGAIMAVIETGKYLWDKIKGIFSAISIIIKGSIQTWVAIFRAFVDFIKSLPNALWNGIKAIINMAIAGFETMINKAIDGLNRLIRYMNKIPGINISKLGRVSLGRLSVDKSAFKGLDLSEATRTGTQAMLKAYATFKSSGGDFTDRISSAFRKPNEEIERFFSENEFLNDARETAKIETLGNKLQDIKEEKDAKKAQNNVDNSQNFQIENMVVQTETPEDFVEEMERQAELADRGIPTDF